MKSFVTLFTLTLLILIKIITAKSIDNLSSQTIDNGKISITTEINKTNGLPVDDVDTKLKREKRQLFYYPNFIGYPDYFGNSLIKNRRTTRSSEPINRRTTQKYSIWDLTRRKRSLDDSNDEKGVSTSIENTLQPHNNRVKRQLNNNNYIYNPLIDFNNFNQLRAIRSLNLKRSYLPKYSMWDLTRKKRSTNDENHKIRERRQVAKNSNKKKPKLPTYTTWDLTKK